MTRLTVGQYAEHALHPEIIGKIVELTPFGYVIRVVHDGELYEEKYVSEFWCREVKEIASV